MKSEVIVVGGGPVGLHVAEITAKAGLETIVVEEDLKIGRPVSCAGLVSPRVLSMTKTKSVTLKARKAVINPPDGKPLVLDASETRAVVINRGKFDREMAKKAADAGAEIRIGAKTIGLNSTKNGIIVRKNGKKQKIRADIIVGADGAHSSIRSFAGFDRPEILLPGIQAIVGENSNDIEIYLGNKYAPGFFAWELPFSTGKLVGVASNDRMAFKHLCALLKNKGYHQKVIGYLSGTIPLGKMKDSVKDGVMLVGDAACQVKPLSGGGIYTGLKSAEHCADVIIKSNEEGDTSKEKLIEYHNRWKKDIGKEISKGLWIRKAYQSLTDEELNHLVSLLREEEVKKLIEEEGDIDYPSKLVRPVLKRAPKLLKLAGPLIKNIF